MSDNTTYIPTGLRSSVQPIHQNSIHFARASHARTTSTEVIGEQMAKTDNLLKDGPGPFGQSEDTDDKLPPRAEHIRKCLHKAMERIAVDSNHVKDFRGQDWNKKLREIKNDFFHGYCSTGQIEPSALPEPLDLPDSKISVNMEATRKTIEWLEKQANTQKRGVNTALVERSPVSVQNSRFHNALDSSKACESDRDSFNTDVAAMMPLDLEAETVERSNLMRVGDFRFPNPPTASGKGQKNTPVKSSATLTELEKSQGSAIAELGDDNQSAVENIFQTPSHRQQVADTPPSSVPKLSTPVRKLSGLHREVTKPEVRPNSPSSSVYSSPSELAVSPTVESPADAFRAKESKTYHVFPPPESMSDPFKTASRESLTYLKSTRSMSTSLERSMTLPPLKSSVVAKTQESPTILPQKLSPVPKALSLPPLGTGDKNPGNGMYAAAVEPPTPLSPTRILQKPLTTKAPKSAILERYGPQEFAKRQPEQPASQLQPFSTWPMSSIPRRKPLPVADLDVIGQYRTPRSKKPRTGLASSKMVETKSSIVNADQPRWSTRAEPQTRAVSHDELEEDLRMISCHSDLKPSPVEQEYNTAGKIRWEDFIKEQPLRPVQEKITWNTEMQLHQLRKVKSDRHIGWADEKGGELVDERVLSNVSPELPKPKEKRSPFRLLSSRKPSTDKVTSKSPELPAQSRIHIKAPTLGRSKASPPDAGLRYRGR